MDLVIAKGLALTLLPRLRELFPEDEAGEADPERSALHRNSRGWEVDLRHDLERYHSTGRPIPAARDHGVVDDLPALVPVPATPFGSAGRTTVCYACSATRPTGIEHTCTGRSNRARGARTVGGRSAMVSVVRTLRERQSSLRNMVQSLAAEYTISAPEMM